MINQPMDVCEDQEPETVQTITFREKVMSGGIENSSQCSIKSMEVAQVGRSTGKAETCEEPKLFQTDSGYASSHIPTSSPATSVQPESADLREACTSLSDADLIVAEENERLATISLSGSDNSNDAYDVSTGLDQEARYKKLIELLTKSKFYTDFLVTKIESQNSINKTRKKRKGKKQVNDGACSQSELRKRKSNQNISQIMGIAEGIISSKRAKVEDGSPVEDGPPDSATEGFSTVKMPDEENTQTKTLPNGLIVPIDQPELLIGACLRDYQIEGLEWMKVLYENGVNGILADEMGLGKTIQVVALIAHLISKKVRGPFLVIGPLSTLPNWLLEFERFTPDIPVILYHGTPEARSEAKSAMNKKTIIGKNKVYPVVLTSYEYPLKDVKILRKFDWSYIIIDEGHRIKNHNSMLSKALRTYNSTNRLLLTGTPLHNNLSELWALLNFLLPEIFDNLEVFESWFNVVDLEGDSGNLKVLEEEKEKKVLSTMHQILAPFMLRRVKLDVNLNLPPKKELIVYAPMTPIQLELYKAVLDYNFKKLSNKSEEEDSIVEGAKRKCTLQSKRYVFKDLQFDENGDVADSEVSHDNKTLVLKDPESKSYAINVKMQNTGMMVRKIVNHPYLIQYPLEPGTAYARIDEDIVRTSGKLQVLDAMLYKLNKRGHKVLLFSTFTTLLDILEDYLSLRKYKYLRLDGNTTILDRREYITQFNNDPKTFLFLISTRAGGLGINLAAADTVILYDSDWNPQIDLQAQDRCHRIGQTRPVVVYRFVTAGTIDEKIVVRGAAKRKLEKMIIQKGNFSMNSKQGVFNSLDLGDLEKLLNSRDHHGVIHPNGFVFSDQELDQLLDRSDMKDGHMPETSSDGLEQRPFKEYYGYTGVVEGGTAAIKSSAEIIDDTSKDETPPTTLLRKKRTRSK